ncbi:MAG: response regulator [Myxococcaceae bacterium]|nr:response regulator [Myxococcaceae bacterium]
MSRLRWMMGGPWRRWLTPPQFDDEVLTQRARLLHRVVSSVLVIIVPFAIAGYALGPRPLFALVFYSGFAALHVGLLVALSRGWVAAVGTTYVAIYFAVMTLLTWFGGGVQANLSAAYVTITLLAGLTVSPTAGVITATVAGLVTVFIAWAERAGHLPAAFQPNGLVEDVTSNLANLVFAAVFVSISMRGLREALARSRAATALMQVRARQDAALASLGRLVLAAPSGEAFAQGLVATVRDTLSVGDIAVVEWSERPRVIAGLGEGARLFAAAPVVTGPEIRDGGRIAPELSGVRVALAPVPGDGSPRGILVSRAPDAPSDDEALLAFLASAASLLGTRLARDEDHGLLRQAQKMEVVGRLAGGVAHDFNNLLTTILGCTSLLELSAKGEDASLVRDIKEASERAALMTRQLLAFSRKQVFRPQPVDLNVAVREFDRVLQRLVRSDVTVALDLSPGPAVLVADRASLEQVLLNLVVNARDAMPKGGRMTVRTRVEANEVVLEVCDTGEGMSDATRAHLFEPFFTTKADGTGLGLPTVRGIVERTHGRIAVQSAPGEGTTFTLTFPRGPDVQPASSPPQRAATGSGRLLLVDDDEAVRATTRRVLEGAGYEVIDVPSAERALELSTAAAGFALVITDLVMPGMSGTVLAQRLAEAGHAWPVLFISGFVADQLPGEAFLAKPFQPSELLSAVERLLVGSRRGQPHAS